MANAQQVLGEEIPAERLRACREQLAQTADLTQYTRPRSGGTAHGLSWRRRSLSYFDILCRGKEPPSRARRCSERFGDTTPKLRLAPSRCTWVSCGRSWSLRQRIPSISLRFGVSAISLSAEAGCR